MTANLPLTYKQFMLIVDMTIDFEDHIRENYTKTQVETFNSLCDLLDSTPNEII